MCSSVMKFVLNQSQICQICYLIRLYLLIDLSFRPKVLLHKRKAGMPAMTHDTLANTHGIIKGQEGGDLI